MPYSMEIEPDDLRRIAKQHELRAADLRKWGAIPDEWLVHFKRSRGSIADPVQGALADYYQRRYDRAEQLAIDQERSRDQLIASANALEEAERTSGSNITQAGGGVDNKTPQVGPEPGTPPGPAAPVGTNPDTPILHDTQPGQHSPTTPDAPGRPDETGRSDQTPPPTTSAPQTYGTTPAGSTTPIGTPPLVGIPTMPPAVDIPESNATYTPVTPTVEANSPAGVATSDMSSVPGMAGGIGAPLATSPSAAPADAGHASMARGEPTPLATGPFAAAIHAAADKDRQALPSFVVGEQADEDLVLARTVLAATLAAVADSRLGLEWAVAVLRTPVGPVVLLTSTEGRGWLPPGLFLPSEVNLPWGWDLPRNGAAREAIAAAREAIAELENTTDPARMLAECGLMGRHEHVSLSALVSSAEIPDTLRAALDVDVAIEDRVPAEASAVDFTSPGVGLVDRLALAGSDELLRQAATVPEAEIRAKCIELARAADARVRTAASGIDAQDVAHRALRHQILDALDAGLPIPASWLDQLRAADDMTAAALRSQRMDVSHVPAGSVRLDAATAEALRDMVFERRANELLALLATRAPDRQTLRDVLYTYGQIVEHPLLPAAAGAVAQSSVTTVTGSTVPNIEVARSVGPSAHGVSSVSSSGAPPPITELLRVLAGPEGSDERKKA
ncbi:hypothetical protein ACLMAL_18180 [Nocardia sp. CWNU-33]|uniref:hypothetical protein n=1 Tax=Nocardia sp. CWNU-33 TaxID=3392117 RepID=UPI00398EEF32